MSDQINMYLIVSLVLVGGIPLLMSRASKKWLFEVDNFRIFEFINLFTSVIATTLFLTLIKVDAKEDFLPNNIQNFFLLSLLCLLLLIILTIVGKLYFNQRKVESIFEKLSFFDTTDNLQPDMLSKKKKLKAFINWYALWVIFMCSFYVLFFCMIAMTLYRAKVY